MKRRYRQTTRGGRLPLPPGVELYSLGVDGHALLTDGRQTADLLAGDGLLRFIDDGQRARYLVGGPQTGPDRPSNATYKLGVVRPHSAFTPHAHGGEHFVLSLGYASCGLYHPDREAVLDVPLPPGTMIRIPPLLPHSFGNRAARPLLILAANTGFGIDHEDYAITAAEAERRAATAAVPDVDYPRLAKALRRLEADPGRSSMTWREHAADRLRRIAERLEARR